MHRVLVRSTCLVATLWAATALPCSYRLGPASGTFAADAGPEQEPLPPPDAGDDPTPPGKASVKEVSVRLVENGARGEGGSCPDLDLMRFVVDGADDVTPQAELFLAGFIAADLAALSAKTAPELFFQHDPGGETPGLVTIVLGASYNRGRDDGPFRSSQPYCFAISLRDRGGNLGARSEPVCLDTSDPRGPFAEVVPSTQGCSAASGGGLLPLGLGLALLSFARRSRRRPERPPS